MDETPRAVCADPERLDALRRYGILDTPREPEFDGLCQLAADLYKAPMALITLVDRERQWFKSAWGIDWQEMPLEASVCAFTICRRDGLVIPDVLADPYFRTLPALTGGAQIRFYAGAVIRTPGGHPLGTICALDYAPHQSDPAQLAALGRLAGQAMALLSLRRSLKEAQERHAPQPTSIVRGADDAAWFRRCFDADVFGMFVVDREGAIQAANSRFLDLIGSTQTELRRGELSGLDLVPSGDADATRDPAGVAGAFGPVEHEFERPDGSRVPVLVGGVRNLNDAAALAIVVDQSARAANEDELRRDRELLRRILASADDWIEILDLNGRLLATGYASDSRQQFNAAVAGSDWLHRWRGVARASVQAALDEAHSGRVGRFEGCLSLGDEEETWWEVMLTPVLGDDGRPERLLAVSRDVTSRHTIAAQLAESEARYRALSEVSPQAVWMSDADGWITYVNEYWLRFTGLSLGDALGDGWLEVIHPEHRARVRETFQRHLRSGEPYENEIPFRSAANGEYRWFLNCAKPSRGADGRIRGWLGVSVDIHERKLAQERLAASEHHARAVLDGLPLHVGVFSPEGALLEVNRPTAEALGAGHAMLLGQVFSESPYCALRPELQRKLRAAMASARAGNPSRFDMEGTRPDGRRGTWDISLVPLFDDSRRVTHLLACAQDVTDRVRAQRALAGSEERSRTFIDATSDTVWWSSATGALVEPQPGWEEFTGQRWEEYRGFGWAAVIHPEDRDTLRKRWAECVAAKQPFLSEHRVRRADGEERMVSARVIPVLDEHGELREWVGAYTDITERRRAEAALRESEARFRSVFENTAVPIFLWQGECFVDANEPAARLLGFNREELRTHHVSWRAITPPGYEELDWRMYEHLLEHGVTPPFAKEYYRKDGVRIPVEMVAAVFAGETQRGVAFVSDISYRQRAEAELREALDAAQRASEAKDDFIAQLSHELRTPLTPVLMSVSSLIESGGLDPTLREDLQLILRNVQLEARLIDDLLDVTRIAHGKLELHLQACGLHGLIEHALRVCDTGLGVRQIRVTFRAEALDHTVRGDPTRLQQVFWNLVNNAVKFTPVGGRIEIVSSNPEPGRVHVSVRDNGIGIPPARIPILFDAFEQGDAVVTRQFGGLGLGLAICKGIVELHGGRISAHSEGVGCGTEFCVELATLSPEEIPALPLAAAPRDGENGAETGAPMPLRILFIEDHENTAQVLGRLLRRAGHEVAQCGTVEEGKRLGASGEYDLVISDLGLPDGSGLELMKWLRERHPNLRGIALSGFGTQADMLASRAAGFEYHLVKPVEWRHLKATMQAAARAERG